MTKLSHQVSGMKKTFQIHYQKVSFFNSFGSLEISLTFYSSFNYIHGNISEHDLKLGIDEDEERDRKL
jgi:hypothetical protein